VNTKKIVGYSDGRRFHDDGLFMERRRRELRRQRIFVIAVCAITIAGCFVFGKI
jgi:hypothetical protein